MAADAGFIGMVTTSASGIQVAPTGGAEAKYGTDPIASVVSLDLDVLVP